MADQKKYLRTMLGECRASLAPHFTKSHSVTIQRRLLATDCYRDAPAVVLYSPIDNEVATDLVASDAIASGKELFFPRLRRDRETMTVARVHALSELVRGAFGIREPGSESASARPYELTRALVVVPGLAFGPQGQRLGRGGGHYDRFLAALPREAITVGLAYSFQLLDRIPQESFDRRLQIIITESALLRVAEPQVQPLAAEVGRGGTPG
jgi:5-formyltetrahydrofolate cyclo-ligase